MRPVLLTTFALVAASCSNDSGPRSPIPDRNDPPEVTFAPDTLINEDNGLDAAAAGVRASFDLLHLTQMCARFLREPEPEPPEPIAPGALATLYSKTVNGTAGGSAQFSWDDRNDDYRYNTGDVFTVTFDGYRVVGVRLGLTGTITIEDFKLAGVLPGDGTWIVDATLNFRSLTVELGAAEITVDYALPFRMENRQISETLDVFLFEDFPYGEYIFKRGSSWRRIEDDDVLLYGVLGEVWAGSLEGSVSFNLTSQPPESEYGMLFSNPFAVDPIAGILYVRGTANSYLEVEPNCIVPGVCFSVDVRVNEDGEEGFEANLSTSWDGMLPQ